MLIAPNPCRGDRWLLIAAAVMLAIAGRAVDRRYSGGVVALSMVRNAELRAPEWAGALCGALLSAL